MACGIFCSGNYEGQAPYENTGALCEQCDSGVCRNGLCADAGKLSTLSVTHSSVGRLEWVVC